MSWRAAILALLCAVPTSLGQAADIVSIAVYPSALHLTSARDKAVFVVQATSSDGITTDVTAEANITFVDNDFIRWDGHALFPAADGVTQMTVGYGGRWAIVPITVRKAKEDRPISFLSLIHI